MGTSRQNEVIYKRRRLAALVILLVVVVLIIAGVTALRGGSSDDESENTAATSPLLTTSAVEANTGDAAGSSVDSTADPDATDTADKSEEPRESGEATASPSETSTTGPAKDAKDSCELSDLIITASSNKPNFTPGEQPQLYMTVGNPPQRIVKSIWMTASCDLRSMTWPAMHVSGPMWIATRQWKPEPAFSRLVRNVSSRQSGPAPVPHRSSAQTASLSLPVPISCTP